MQKIEIAHRIHQTAGISKEEAATLLNWIIELFKSGTRTVKDVMSILNRGDSYATHS